METKSIKLKTIIYVMVLSSLSLLGFAQQKSKVVKSKPAIQFPSEEYKTKWIIENPSTYESMGGSLSQAQQSQVNAKQTENQNTLAKKVIVIFPDISSFPKYEQTGNPLVDNENYRIKKDAWINTHQAEYNRMNLLNNPNGNSRVSNKVTDNKVTE